MKLAEYDSQCIELTDQNDDIFAGSCQYLSRSYTFHEFGVKEDGLQIANWVFYRLDIKSITPITDMEPFLTSYGKIEQCALEDGMDTIEDIFYYEDSINSIRLLNAIEDSWKQENSPLHSNQEALKQLLTSILNITEDKQLKEKLKDTLAVIEKRKTI